ncbi:HesB/IscA family protein [Marinospirillum sp.]|uniref:HesB/IscA family protein n=1 Tax=Marinospirillum sp. TaxID=2183934 RepID=UPI003A87EAF8
MSISVSLAAAQHIQRCLKDREQAIGLRIKIKPSGCSGFSYVLDFAETQQEDDLLFEQHGVTILVDPESYPYIEGTEVDYVQEGVNSFFRFKNPKVKDECGCGESFSV